MLTRTATVTLNSVTNLIRFGLLIIVFFFLTPFIIQSIGKEEFGLWSLVFSVLGVFGLLDLGFGTGVVKWVSEAKASGNVQWRNEILSTTLVIYLVLSFIGIGFIAGLSFFFNTLFSIPSLLQSKALTIFWILAARTLILQLPLSIFKGILFGEQKIYQLNFIQSIFSVVYAGLVFAFLSLDYGIIAMAWINLAVMIGEHLTYIVFARRECFNLKLAWNLSSFKLLREAISFSFYSFIVQTSALVLLRTDTILIKFFLPLSAVALYALSLKVTEYIHLVVKQFTNVLMPVVAEFKESQDTEKIRFLLVNASKFALVPSVMILAAILVYAEEALVLWVGEDFRSAAPILRILVCAIIIAVPQLSAASVLTMTGHHKYFAMVSMAGMILNVAVSAILITRYGLIGVAAGTLVTVLVIDLFIIVRRAFSIYGVPYSALITRIFLPTMLPGVLQLVVAYQLKIHFPPSNLFFLVLVNLPGVVIYATVFFVFGVEASEKRLLKEKLFRFMRSNREIKKG